MVGWIIESASYVLAKSLQVTPGGAKVFNWQYLFGVRFYLPNCIYDIW